MRPVGRLLNDKGHSELTRAFVSLDGFGFDKKSKTVCNKCGNEIKEGESFKIYYKGDKKITEHKSCPKTKN